MQTFKEVITFPNAKINIGLYITGKRSDGYHNIQSVFYPIPLCDALEIVRAEDLKFTTSGLTIPGNETENLCLKAYHLMREQYAGIQPVHIHLHKAIPMGAGLGGGSADGAFMINLLNDFFELDLSISEREKMAAELGSDCPFFIENEPKYVSGRGEVMEPHPIDLKGWYLAVVSPGIHVSTKEAYASIEPKEVDFDWAQIDEDHVGSWTTHGLINQFETGVAKLHPSIDQAKSELQKLGAAYVSMTGSGSAVYGLFQQKPARDNFNGWLLEL